MEKPPHQGSKASIQWIILVHLTYNYHEGRMSHAKTYICEAGPHSFMYPGSSTDEAQNQFDPVKHKNIRWISTRGGHHLRRKDQVINSLVRYVGVFLYTIKVSKTYLQATRSRDRSAPVLPRQYAPTSK